MRSLAALALLLAAFAAPPALAQGGGVTAPRSGGVPAPDPAPEPQSTPLAPDAAPGAGSDSVEAAPSPQTSPTPAAPPDTTSVAPEASAPRVAASEPAAPRADRRRSRRSGDRAAQSKARAERTGRQDDRRPGVGHVSPASVFRASLASVGWAGTDTDTESSPVQLVAFALLTLVVASAALLRLTTRLSQMEGLRSSRVTSRSATQR